MTGLARMTVVYSLAIGMLVPPLAAVAQQAAKVPRVGILLYGTPEADPLVGALRRGLRDLGYTEGQSLSIEYRFAAGRPERLPDLAAELVRLNPDVIVAVGEGTAAAQRATRTVPIVMWVSNDPVQAGFVASLPRPGENITGVTLIHDELAGKRLALLKELMPRVSRVGILWNPDHADPEFRETQRAARVLGVQLESLEVRRGEDFGPAFKAATTAHIEALVVVSSRMIHLHRPRIVSFAKENRLPLVGDWGPWAPAGALLSYGPNPAEMVRQVASYVDKILKGAKPADLPVQQPTKFELVVNLSAAKALGVTIPDSVLHRADQVIQ